MSNINRSNKTANKPINEPPASWLGPPLRCLFCAFSLRLHKTNQLRSGPLLERYALIEL